MDFKFAVCSIKEQFHFGALTMVKWPFWRAALAQILAKALKSCQLLFFSAHIFSDELLLLLEKVLHFLFLSYNNGIV